MKLIEFGKCSILMEIIFILYNYIYLYLIVWYKDLYNQEDHSLNFSRVYKAVIR